MTVCTNGQVILEEKYRHRRFTKSEVVDYAKWLGINLKQEPELYSLVFEGIKAPLPVGWKPCMNTSGEIYYFNFFTGQSTWDHPCDVYYKHKVLEYRKNKRHTNVTERKQKYSKKALHKKTWDTYHGIKLLHIGAFSKPTSNLTQNNGTPMSNNYHYHNLQLLNEQSDFRNVDGKKYEPLVSKLKPLENSSDQPKKSTGVQYESPYEVQTIPSKETRENANAQTTLTLVNQVDANLNISLLSSSENLTNSIKPKTPNVSKSHEVSETTEDELNSIHCHKTTNNKNTSTDFLVYKKTEESTDSKSIDKINNNSPINNHSQTKIGMDCVTELLRQMEQNHEEVLGASYKLCSMQKELVNWCSEIEQRLYSIDSKYRIIFCQDRILSRNNNLRIFLGPREIGQQDYIHTSVCKKATPNECPPHNSYSSHLPVNKERRRPHSGDDHLLRSEKNSYTETRPNTIDTNSLLSKTAQIENLVSISNSKSQNLVKHLSVVDLSKLRHTITDGNRLPSDWTTMQTKSYYRRFLDSPKNLPQDVINQQLEDYSRWLEQAEAYMKTLRSA
ncbi:unnamed protein product [Schistosoma turkestanicum]|nr:unnamed protein product [Schistosoma turkestanicum]